MALRQESRIVSFDGDEACQWLVEDLGRDLRTVAEYSPGEYRLLYVSDEVVDDYGSLDAVEEVGDSLHEYLELDFQERELFVDLYPTVDEVEGFATVTEAASEARVLTDDEGLYFSVAPGVSVVPAISELAERIASE